MALITLSCHLNVAAERESFHLRASSYPGRESHSQAWEVVINENGEVHQYLLGAGGKVRNESGSFLKRTGDTTINLDPSQLEQLRGVVAACHFFTLKGASVSVFDSGTLVLEISEGDSHNKVIFYNGSGMFEKGCRS